MIVSLNGEIKKLCSKYGHAYADFHSQLILEDGLTLKPVHFGDELHPHVSGYDIMAKENSLFGKVYLEPIRPI